MAQTDVTTQPSDTDIEARVHDVMHGYPPLTNDRHQVSVTVENATITVAGHVKTLVTFKYVRENLAAIPGVTGLDSEQFFNDESIRRGVGHVVPAGTQVNVEYGAVILTGPTPDDPEALVKEVALVPGVRRVITAFR
jgi:osmotically-inducible protein OsmY